MAVTGDIFRSLTFDGESSRDYGVYITGQAVYNAPERDVEMVTIPGRNGAFALDKGRFENIEVTYPAGVFANTDTEFAKAISDFRNMLCSRQGYCRLTDEYNPDEYRLAVYKSGLEVDPVQLKAGQFDITFECKPQRYLTSGEEKKVLGTWGDTETKTGEIVELENDGSLAVKSAEVALEPQQDLHGYDKPWAGGNGKNLLPNTGATKTENNVTFTPQADGSVLVNSNGAASGTATYRMVTNADAFTLPAGSYIISGAKSSNQSIGYNTTGGTTGYSADPNGDTVTFSANTTFNYIFIRIASGQVLSNVKFYPMIRLASVSDSTYEPYENICPITGASDVDVNVADDYDDPQTLNTFTTSLGTTVYGGSVDVVAGTGEMTWAGVDMGDLSWTYHSGNTCFYALVSGKKYGAQNLMCSAYKVGNGQLSVPDGQICGAGSSSYVYVSDPHYTDATTFKTAMTGQKIVYETDPIVTLSLTPTTVNLIEGTNYVFSPQGEITLEYGTNPNALVNPTLFASSPLIEAKGYGDITFNGHTIKLQNGVVGTVNLWDKTLSYSINGTFTKQVQTGLFESTDTFSFNVFTTVQVTETTAPTVTNTNASATNSSSSSIGLHQVALPCTFTVSTSGTATNTCTYDFGSSKTVVVNMTCTYDASTGTVTYSTSTSSTGGIIFVLGKGCYCGLTMCNATSTLNRLGDPTYIDCDLGEAYKINDGDVIGLNQFIDLGSKLPELAPSINEFTVSNTFTEVAVVPRWWIV